MKIIAAQRKTTFKELVIQGLALVAQLPEGETLTNGLAKQRLVAGLKSRNVDPLVPLKREEIYER